MEASEYSQVHNHLMEFARLAVTEGRTTGLRKFFYRRCPSDIAPAVLAWLEQFTPIRPKAEGPLGRLQFNIIKGTDGSFDLSAAKLNPFWGICSGVKKPVSTRVKSLDSSQHTTAKFRETPLSERQFAEVRLKKAVEAFLTDRTVESRATVIVILDEIYSSGNNRRGSPFVQAGAPGLGRRA